MMTERTRSTSTAKKNPCGKCQDECGSGNAVVCGFCEFWYHSKCIDGMTPEFIKCCDAINKFYGGSSFLCAVCRKITGMLNRSMKELEAKISTMESKLTIASLERKCMTEKIQNLEERNRQVGEEVQKIEGEVASGMERAKEEVKDEMRDELKRREENKDKITVYGLKEPNDADGKKRKCEDEEMVKTMAAEIGVDFKGEIKASYRSGEKIGDRPRPLIVTIEDEETREGILANARRMSGKDEWRRVFVGQALTWSQREEARKEEKKLKDEATKKTEELAGGEGKYIVVGQRGKRWVKWVREIRGG